MAGRGLGRHRRGRAPGPLRAEEEVREARLDDDRQRLLIPAQDDRPRLLVHQRERPEVVLCFRRQAAQRYDREGHHRAPRVLVRRVARPLGADHVSRSGPIRRGALAADVTATSA